MVPQPDHNMHYQAGIDWTKAARIAMAPDPAAPKKDGFVTSFGRCKSASGRLDCQQKDATLHPLASGPSIKYPATVGHRRDRVPNRDSFLRGGTQFKSFQHSSKTGSDWFASKKCSGGLCM